MKPGWLVIQALIIWFLFWAATILLRWYDISFVSNVRLCGLCCISSHFFFSKTIPLPFFSSLLFFRLRSSLVYARVSSNNRCIEDLLHFLLSFCQQGGGTAVASIGVRACLMFSPLFSFFFRIFTEKRERRRSGPGATLFRDCSRTQVHRIIFSAVLCTCRPRDKSEKREEVDVVVEHVVWTVDTKKERQIESRAKNGGLV